MLKNAIVYSVIMPGFEKMSDTVTSDVMKARKPLENEQLTRGWGDNAVVALNNGYRLSLTIWEKKIKPSIVRQLTNEQCDLFDRQVTKKERQEIQTEITTDLIRVTPAEKKVIHAYYLTESCQLIVDAGSANDAEAMVGFIRMTLGSLKTTTLHVDMVNGLTKHIRDYLENSNQMFLPHYKLGGDIKLVDLNGANVTYKGLNLTDEGTAGEIIAMIDEAFMTVKSVEMVSLDESFSFTLTDGFKFKQIKFEATDTDDVYDDLASETYTISRLVNELVGRFDAVGEDED